MLNLLTGLNPNKAAGPDQIKPRVLKELAEEITPMVTLNQKNCQLPATSATSAAIGKDEFHSPSLRPSQSAALCSKTRDIDLYISK